ncbi:hypothetical protein [Dactylosporangium sp. CA-233914]
MAHVAVPADVVGGVGEGEDGLQRPDPDTDFDHGLLLTGIQARLATATAQ